MTRAVEQIERDIAALEQSVAAIAQDLYAAYGDYLTDLGQAVKRQLVLAAYHVCTQGYPDRFLALSLSQRQELQETLKQLAQQARVQLANRLMSLDEFHLAMVENQLKHHLADEALADDASDQALAAQGLTDQDLTDEDLADDELADPSLPEDEANNDLADEEVFESELSVAELLHENGSFLVEPPVGSSQAPPLESDRSQSHEQERSSIQDTSEAPATEESHSTSDPMLVMSWQDDIEKGIAAVLHTLSYAANRLLEKSNILPAKLPEPILEVAAKVGSDMTSGPPNLLTLLIETQEEDEEPSKMTHIITLRLRLAEIEFVDPTLGAWRSKIRGLLARLNQLERDYQKKHREKAIATAEAAWRSTWLDE